MSMREKIIAFFAVLSIIGGIYYFSIPYIGAGISPRATFRKPDLNGFVQEATSALIQENDTKKYRFIMEQIDADWRNPFFEPEEKSIQSKSNIKSLPQYSGYVIMGNRRIAIIGGVEYAVGDVLEQSGYKVVEIHPTHVVIKIDENSLLNIPLIETD